MFVIGLLFGKVWLEIAWLIWFCTWFCSWNNVGLVSGLMVTLFNILWATVGLIWGGLSVSPFNYLLISCCNWACWIYKAGSTNGSTLLLIIISFNAFKLLIVGWFYYLCKASYANVLGIVGALVCKWLGNWLLTLHKAQSLEFLFGLVYTCCTLFSVFCLCSSEWCSTSLSFCNDLWEDLWWDPWECEC